MSDFTPTRSLYPRRRRPICDRCRLGDHGCTGVGCFCHCGHDRRLPGVAATMERAPAPPPGGRRSGMPFRTRTPGRKT